MPVRVGWNIHFCSTICFYHLFAGCLIVLSHTHLFNLTAYLHTVCRPCSERLWTQAGMFVPRLTKVLQFASLCFLCQYFNAHLASFAPALNRTSWKWYLETLHTPFTFRINLGWMCTDTKETWFWKKQYSHRSRPFSIRQITLTTSSSCDPHYIHSSFSLWEHTRCQHSPSLGIFTHGTKPAGINSDPFLSCKWGIWFKSW